MRRDSERLRDIIGAATQIAGYLKLKSMEDFVSDPLLRDAVLRQLIIVGEAAINISSGLRAAHPEIPWEHIAGFRHRVVHDYLGLNLDTAWAVATGSLPELADQARSILTSEFGEF